MDETSDKAHIRSVVRAGAQRHKHTSVFESQKKDTNTNGQTDGLIERPSLVILDSVTYSFTKKKAIIISAETHREFFISACGTTSKVDTSYKIFFRTATNTDMMIVRTLK